MMASHFPMNEISRNEEQMIGLQRDLSCEYFDHCQFYKMEATQTQAVRNIKALLCQLSPVHKQKKTTIDRVRISLQRYTPESQLDIIIFPEMSFVGYNFATAKEAQPFSVRQDEGIDFDFAKEIATKTKAYVAFGYIQREQANGQTLLYNSAAVVDRTGKFILNYRKSHLYYNDKLWAKEGSEFTYFDLITTQNKTIRCALAICMDINPKEFTSNQWEIANYVVKTKSDVLLFLTNWVDSEKAEVVNSDIAATYNYWIHRLQPVILSKKTVLFLAADRVGVQYDVFAKKETMFYGSSCAVMFNPSKILKNLDIKSQGYLLIDTHLP